MNLSRIVTFPRSIATLSLLAALVASATVTGAPKTVSADTPLADTQSEFIMSDGRICNPRWGCNLPDLGTEAPARP
jgi:hypothetical protein